MFHLIQAVNDAQRKKKVVDVRSGDTVRVHQKIREGNKERIQVFEGVVIRTDRKSSLTSSFTVRRIASGVGVEKSFLIHSPLILKVEITKRSKVRRNYLSYLRQRSGKSARLTGVDFDRIKVNAANKAAEEEIEQIKEELAEKHDEYAKEEAAELKAAEGEKK
jgi:large subunit ribosomal protein L19